MATIMNTFSHKIPSLSASLSNGTIGKGPCLRQLVCHRHRVLLKSSYSTSPSTQSWQLMSAVCLERYPVISNELDGIQRRFQNMVDQQELERSYLSEHEIQVAHEMELITKKKKGLMTEEEDDIETSDTSALELEDKAKIALTSFVPADRITEADEKNDVRSLERKLDDKLILLVKSKIGDDVHWMMPQGSWQQGESLKETAQRVLSAHCSSDNLSTKFISGIPAGFYKYKYPKTMRKEGDKIGAKVFFFKARYLGGDFKPNANMADDHVWVTLDQLDQYVNQSYAHKINKFILPATLSHVPEDWDKQVPYAATASC